MAQVTLYLPEGGVEDFPNAQEVGIEEGFLTFVNQLGAPDRPGPPAPGSNAVAARISGELQFSGHGVFRMKSKGW